MQRVIFWWFGLMAVFGAHLTQFLIGISKRPGGA